MFYVWPEQSVIEIGRGGVSFYLTYTQNGFMFLNQFCQPVDIKEVESIGFRGLEGFASNRGYIWSRSLPLLKHALFVGYGPDTFAAHFPNHDYIGKLKVWGGGIFTMIEKPHNLYLQIAINSGILSLIAVLALFFRYLLTSAKAYWKCDYSRFTEISGIAIFAAVVAYLIISIFNDSVVAVAPVFWSLLGLGIATNRINRTRNAQSN
jgi:O-antigen ligase